MGQPRVKWGQVERYCARNGYVIKSSGGDKIIIAPKNGRQRGRQTVRIGHTSCSHAGTELLKVYESKLRNVFGIKIEDILNS